MRNLFILVLIGIIIWLVLQKRNPGTAGAAPTPSQASSETALVSSSTNFPAPILASGANPTPTPPTPEEEVAKVLNAPQVSAAELAALFDKYPRQTLAALPGHQLTVSGKVDRVGIFGMEDTLAEVTLAGSPAHRILFSYDLEKGAHTQQKWALLENRLLLVNRHGKQVGRMICQNGEQCSASGFFDSASPSALKFTAAGW